MRIARSEKSLPSRVSNRPKRAASSIARFVMRWMMIALGVGSSNKSTALKPGGGTNSSATDVCILSFWQQHGGSAATVGLATRDVFLVAVHEPLVRRALAREEPAARLAVELR